MNPGSGLDDHDRAQWSPRQAEALTRSGCYSAAAPTKSASVVRHVKDGGGTRCVVAIRANGVRILLYLANLNDGSVDVFDGRRQVNSFTDPTLSRGYAPLEVEILNGSLFVTFIHRDAVHYNGIVEPEHGFIGEFDLSGILLDRAEFRLGRRYGADRYRRGCE